MDDTRGNGALSDDPLFQALVRAKEARGGEQVIVIAAAGDQTASLATEIEAALLTPSDAIHRDRAPVPFIFAVKPPADQAEQAKSWSALVGMSAVIRLYSAMLSTQMQKARDVDGPYSLGNPEEFSFALSDASIATANAVNQNLAMYYTQTSGTTQNESELLKRSEIHDFALARIFKGVPTLKKDQFPKLDEILTDFIQLLKPYKVTNTSGSATLDFCVLIHYVKTTDITGTGDAFVIEPCTRMVNVGLKAEEWTRALTKPGFFKKNDTISFTMVTTITELRLDADKYQTMEPKFTSVLGRVCGDSTELKECLDKEGIQGFGRRTLVFLNDDRVVDRGDGDQVTTDKITTDKEVKIDQKHIQPPSQTATAKSVVGD